MIILPNIQFNQICQYNVNKSTSFCGNEQYTNNDTHITQELYNIAQLNTSVIKTSNIKDTNLNYPLHTKKNYIGCLLGGAVGDALGNPVEFYPLRKIKYKFGENGITEMKLCNGKAEITDDTQMTIFTADGLLKSMIKKPSEEDLPDMNLVYNSYQDWLKTQYKSYTPTTKGWLSNIKDLYAQRAPGLTCTGALESGVAGSIEKTINTSKGCGGIMRTAPAGLIFYKNPKLAFEVGARCAALTHGSPDAYLPAGFHSAIIANIINGNDIETSVENTIQILKNYDKHENVLSLVEKAKEFAHSNIDSETAIRKLGEGWHGDEALAIAVYCILKSPNDFEKAVIMSVNHDGDSDSTGSIVGNIMGAKFGIDGIPDKWKNKLELSSQLTQLATDLYLSPNKIENSQERYPIS